MFDRLLLSIIVALSAAPANAAAQILIEGSDAREVRETPDAENSPASEPEEEGAEGNSGDGRPNEGDEGTNDEASSSDDRAAPGAESRLTIEGYGGDDAGGDEAAEASAQPGKEPDADTTGAGELENAVRSTVQRLISNCVGETARPAKHGLSGRYVASMPPTGVVETRRVVLIARPADLDYAPAMFLTEEEAALATDEVAGRLEDRRAEFIRCTSEIEIPLETRPPSEGPWTLRFEFRWDPPSQSGTLGAVEWTAPFETPSYED